MRAKICKSGVYQIRNLVNGKLYIGSAADLANRRFKHFRDLRNGDHHNPHLQRAWDKYGSEAFIFEVKERCEQEILLQREQWYIDFLEPEYNNSQVASAPTLGRHITQDHRLILIDSQRKLTDTEVRAAAILLESGELTGKEIAEVLSVTPRRISMIKHRQAFKHLFDEKGNYEMTPEAIKVAEHIRAAATSLTEFTH